MATLFCIVFFSPRNALLRYWRKFLLMSRCPATLDDRKTFMHAQTPTTPMFLPATSARPNAVVRNDPTMMIGRWENDPSPMHTPSDSVAIGQYDWDSTANGTSVAIVFCTVTSATSAPATAGVRSITAVATAADSPSAPHILYSVFTSLGTRCSRSFMSRVMSVWAATDIGSGRKLMSHHTCSVTWCAASAVSPPRAAVRVSIEYASMRPIDRVKSTVATFMKVLTICLVGRPLHTRATSLNGFDDASTLLSILMDVIT
mmetsp:Transcript_24786/g.59788  ORF Transcript_24786/g.59788 Transcript_24786/m.59788 type:complete len:259 (+) Transcript_24786:448-1224(+)